MTRTRLKMKEKSLLDSIKFLYTYTNLYVYKHLLIYLDR